MPNRVRLMEDNPDLSKQLWNQMHAWLKENGFGNAIDEFGDKWECCNINDRFRLVKYKAGEKFSIHEDGVYEKSSYERSFATFMVYLNDVDEELGGATFFIDHNVRIQPKQGLCVVFFVDNLLHCGEKLESGEKYLFRTDIMYRLSRAKDFKLRKEIYEAKKTAESAQDTQSYIFWNKYEGLKSYYKSLDVESK